MSADTESFTGAKISNGPHHDGDPAVHAVLAALLFGVFFLGLFCGVLLGVMFA